MIPELPPSASVVSICGMVNGRDKIRFVKANPITCKEPTKKKPRPIIASHGPDAHSLLQTIFRDTI